MKNVHVALLRGINVGGNNKVPMGVLCALFEDAGCTAVRSYIQSGNVVFSASPSVLKRLPAQLAAGLKARLGLQVPLVLRSAQELVAVAAQHPLAGDEAGDQRLHVAFLAETPTAAAAQALDPHRSPGDLFLLRGRDLYLAFPGGVAKTKLTNAYLDSTLKTVSTLRNWRTVQALAHMCGE